MRNVFRSESGENGWPDILGADLRHLYSPEFEELRLTPADVVGQLPVSVPAWERGFSVKEDVPNFRHDFQSASESVMTRDEEHVMFRNLNYLLWYASRLRAELLADPLRSDAAELAAQIRETLASAQKVRDHIFHANLGLIVPAVTRIGRGKKFTLEELVNEGMHLMWHCISLFDFQSGFKFSTYFSAAANRSLLKRMKRMRGPKRERLETDLSVRDADDSLLTQHSEEGQGMEGGRIQDLFTRVEADAIEWDLLEDWEYQREIEKTLRGLIEGAVLDSRERQLVEEYYGIRGLQRKMLKELGEEHGITKERVRQIIAAALKKLREVYLRKNMQEQD